LRDTPYYEEACQISDKARQERLAEIDELRTEAVKKVDERHISMVKAIFGETEGNRFAAIIESGMTVNQYRNIRPQLEAGGESHELKALHSVKSDIDRALSQPAGDADFMKAVQRVMDSEVITKTEAMARVAAQQPNLQKRYLEARNPGMEV
jgi:hypothetical protein